MDINMIKTLIEMMSASGLASLEVEEGNLRIKLENSTSGKVEQQPAQAIAHADADIHITASAEPLPESSDEQFTEVKSPMVGVYHPLSAVKKDDLTVGARVVEGQLLCVIESMKLMNEIESEVNGEIVQILVSDGDMLEFGQTIMKIK